MTDHATYPRIDGPSAWTAADYADGHGYIYNLSPHQIAELEAFGQRLADTDPALEDVDEAAVRLVECASAVAEWAATLDHGRGFVTLRGLTPRRYTPEQNAAIFYVIGRQLGTPMRQNSEGDVLTHIIAIADREAYNSDVPSSKTTGALVFHSDSSDVVGLMCLRPAADGGASRISCAATIYNTILGTRPDLLPVLFEPFHFDWRLQDHTSPELTYQSPIFAFRNGVLSMYGGSKIVFTAQGYDHVPPLSAEQLEALHLVDSLAGDPSIALDMDFQEGDIQLLLNYTALHSRTSFRDHEDPALRRHLLRLWLRRNGDRPVPDAFGKPVELLDRGAVERPRLSTLVPVPDRLPVSY